MDVPVVSLVVGPPGHGVVRHALVVARASGAVVVRHRRPPPLLHRRSCGVVHLHFTDRLYGDHVTAAADTFVGVARNAGDRTVATLHDVPSGDLDARDRRRASAYRRVAAAVDAVIVTARHERDRLVTLGVDRPIHVVPFPITPRAPAPPVPTRPRSRPEIGVLGFVYPGKGHDVAIEVAGPRRADVVAIGAVSPGHDSLAEDLRRRAAARGVPLTITGTVDERSLFRRLAAVDVPFAVYDDVSASLSMTTWITAGRRPIVAPSAFVDELLELVPDSLVVVARDDHDALQHAVADACARPALTRLDAIPDHLSARAIGEQHVAVYRSLGAPE